MALDPRTPIPAHKAVSYGPSLAARREAAKAARMGQGAVSSGAQPVAVTKAAQENSAAEKTAQKGDGFSFWDLVDIINPLQHIPVVGTIYRSITHDEIKPFARVAGGALFGGVAGALIGGANAAVADGTGKDIGELAMAKLGFGGEQEQKPQTSQQVAQPGAPVLGVGDVGTMSDARGGTDGIPVINVSPRDALKKPLAERALNDMTPAAGTPAAGQPKLRRYADAAHMPHIPVVEQNAVSGAMPQKLALEALDKKAEAAEPQVAADSAPLPPAAIPQEMMQALAKYEAMQKMIKPAAEDKAPRFAGR